jgi:hypothetical protein
MSFDVPSEHNHGLYQIELEWFANKVDYLSWMSFGNQILNTYFQAEASSIKANHIVLTTRECLQASSVNVSNLEPTKLYTFKLRNVSSELQSLRSPAIALKQITRKILEYSHIFRLYYE